MQHHNYSLYDLENMMPYEREIYVKLLSDWLQEEKARHDGAGTRRPQIG